jgi:hypothetical protein
MTKHTSRTAHSITTEKYCLIEEDDELCPPSCQP